MGFGLYIFAHNSNVLTFFFIDNSNILCDDTFTQNYISSIQIVMKLVQQLLTFSITSQQIEQENNL